LALATFAVESIISFSAKVHGQSVIGYGQSLAANSGFQRPLGGGAWTGHVLDLSRFRDVSFRPSLFVRDGAERTAASMIDSDGCTMLLTRFQLGV
jgi:hypothetical protein